MADSFALWHAEHATFTRLLDLLEDQVAAFIEQDNPNFGLMLDVVSYLGEYADRFHHPREDALFTRMVQRDPALRMPINRLLQEHRVIAVASEELGSRLQEIIAGALIKRSTVESAAAIYLAYYRHHLATEENDILPRAARLLQPHDWESIENAVLPMSDPLAAGATEERFRELRELLEGRGSEA